MKQQPFSNSKFEEFEVEEPEVKREKKKADPLFIIVFVICGIFIFLTATIGIFLAVALIIVFVPQQPFCPDCDCNFEYEGCLLSSDTGKGDVNWYDDLKANTFYHKSSHIGEYINDFSWYFSNAETPESPILNPKCSCSGIQLSKATGLIKNRTVKRKLFNRGNTRDGATWWLAQGNVKTVNETYRVLKVNESITVSLNGLSPSLYTFEIYGTIVRNGRTSLERIWKPLPIQFKVFDSSGEIVGKGLMLAKQGFEPRLMNSFSFHAFTKGNYKAEFKVHHTAQESAEILNIVLKDQMYSIPKIAVKKKTNYVGVNNIPIGGDVELDQQRLNRDEEIWENFVNFNELVIINIHAVFFRTAPNDGSDWGIEAFQRFKYGEQYPHKYDELTMCNLDFVNKNNENETFTYEQLKSDEPIPISSTYPDYGACYYDDTTYHCKRPYLLGIMYLNYYHTISHRRHYHDDCIQNGDLRKCHEGALALIRIALDWPGLFMSSRGACYNTCSKDMSYNVDWSSPWRRNGKFYYSGYSGEDALSLFDAYDKLYPYIAQSKSLVTSLKRFIPFINSNKDIIQLLDRYLIMISVRDFGTQVMAGGTPVPVHAGALLGYSATTENLLDFTRVEDYSHPQTGTVQELYAKAYTRDGLTHIGATSYHYPDIIIDRGSTTFYLKKEGYQPKMDLSNYKKYTKVYDALLFFTGIYTAGGYRITYGDASPGPHMSRRSKNYFEARCSLLKGAFELYEKDPLAAFSLVYGDCTTDPEIISISESIRNPVFNPVSRVMHSVQAIIEINEDEDDYMKKHSVTMKLGFGYGHKHNDFLDLNIWSLGMPMAVDIGQRNEGSQWTYPPAEWSYLHNHAMGHFYDSSDGSNNPKYAGDQKREAWITSFTPQSMKGSYVEEVVKEEGFTLDRDIVVMDIDGTDNIYVFDIQRVQGGDVHTWSFHGCESDDLSVNVPTSTASSIRGARWLTRHIDSPRLEGTAIDQVSGRWEMSRQKTQHPYTRMDGGTVETVETEQTVLGDDYDESRPRANTKATLLGHAGDTVLVGSAFSNAYDYVLPMMYVQSYDHSISDISTYPAIYQMYRGDTPPIKSISYTMDPVTVTITTQTNQVDQFYSDGNYLKVISKKSDGTIQFAKLNGDTSLVGSGLTMTVSKGYETATIIDIDYDTRTVTLDSPLPSNPLVVVENPIRSICLQLKGNTGTVFTYDQDLKIGFATIKKFNNFTNGYTDFEYERSIVFERSSRGITIVNEDSSVHIRDQQILKPKSGIISESMFTDENGDGLISVHGFSIGIGSTVVLNSDSTLRLFGSQYKIKSNVPVNVQLGSINQSLQESEEWQLLN